MNVRASQGSSRLKQDFVNPPLAFRPIQIIHAFDGYGKDAEDIGKALERLRDAGCGGVVANVGWPGYVRDEERWRLFLLGAEEARRREMPVWIYDEWGYPSGAAGEFVLDGHPELEVRGIICESRLVAGGEMIRVELPHGAEQWVAAVAILPDAAGSAKVGERIALPAGGREPITWRAPDAEHPWLLYGFASRVMFEDTHATADVFTRRRYVNLIHAQLGKRFVEVTHDQYSRRMSQAALGNVAAAFTDEPSLAVAYHNSARLGRPPALPWCDDLPQEFAKRAGYALEPYLPELFYDIGEVEAVRCDFHRVVGELMAERFFGAIQDWGRQHGVASSGHLECEERLSWHVCYSGDLFRCLRRLDWPGIDLLTSVPERVMNSWAFLLPKFASSVAHIIGAPVVMSETSDHAERMAGGAASMAQMAGTAGLQYALGVNVITSYYRWHGYDKDAAAAWLGDRAAAPDNGYRAYADYVGRLGAMLSGGRHICPAAVYYPVCAMQALYTPSDRLYKELHAHGGAVAALDALVRDLARGLLQRQVDFDFVDDEALAGAEVKRRSLGIGDERYRALILPAARVMEREALAAAVRFAQAGGAVIAVDCLPERVARRVEGDAAAPLVEQLRAAGVEATSLEAALQEAVVKAPPEVVITPASPHILVLHRVTEDGTHVHFITSTSGSGCELTVRLRRAGDVQLYWPRTGAIEARTPQRRRLSVALGPYEGVFIVAG